MFRYGAFLAPHDKQGVWVFNEENQEIRRYKRMGLDTDGDLRVTY